MNFRQGWYLLYTRPKHERKVVHELERRSISLYCPTTKIPRKWHDRIKILTVPLFPSYIFVYLEDMESYYCSEKIDGVLSYVKFGKEIAVVSNKVVDDLRLVIENGYNIEVSDDRFDSGLELMIHSGAFSGLSCEVVEHKNKTKVLVRVKILNRAVLVDMPALHLTGRKEIVNVP